MAVSVLMSFTETPPPLLSSEEGFPSPLGRPDYRCWLLLLSFHFAVSGFQSFCLDEFHGSLAVAYLKVQLPSFASVPFGKRRQTLRSSRYCRVPIHMISFYFSSKMGEVVLPTNSTSFLLGPNVSRDKMILFPFKLEAMYHHP